MSASTVFVFSVLISIISISEGLDYGFAPSEIKMRNLRSINLDLNSNDTYTTYDVKGNHSAYCKVVAIDEVKARDSLKSILDAGAKMVEITLTFYNVSKDINEITEGEMFDLGFWVRTAGKYGRSILLLGHSYQILSLGTLSYDLSTLNVDVTEHPIGCLKNMAADDIENAIKTLLLNDFSTKPGEHSFDENEQICNLLLKDNNGVSEFIYECCHPSGECNDLYPDFWALALSIVIRIVQILAFLYSPYLVPTTWYRSKLAENEYVLNLAKPKQVNIQEKYVNKQLKYSMDKCGGKCFRLKKIRFSIRTYKLVPENKVPVGIMRTLYDSIIRCKISQHPETKRCCESSVCGECLTNSKISWNRCCRALMNSLVMILMTTPIVLWLVEYFMYESKDYETRATASTARQLSMRYQGSITSLPPTHTFFLVCYGLIVTCLVVMAILKCIMKVQGNKNHKMTMFIIRNAFREMCDSQNQRTNVYRGSIISILWPFKKCGVFAVFFCVFYWLICIPLVAIMLCIHYFPAVTVSFKILVQIFRICFPRFVQGCKNLVKRLIPSISLIRDIDETLIKRSDTTNTQKKRLSVFKTGIMFIYAVLCLILLLAVLLIVLECIGFYVQIIMYTIIGIIINASKTLKFLMLIFMITFYARDCLNSVTKMYLNFNQQISKAVQSMCSSDVAQVTEKSAALQENTAFQVNPEGIDPEHDINCKVARGIRKWEMKRVVLFIDKYDEPFITKKFFFDACNMPYVGCPGPVMQHLLRAVFQILTIIVFLIFVICVVLAFGDEYISATNQTLVTLAGGFLPFIFRKVLFSSTGGITVDVNNLNFKNGFNDLINNYIQTWPVSNKFVDIGDCQCDDDDDVDAKEKSSDETAPNENENIEKSSPSEKDDKTMEMGMGLGLGAMAMISMAGENATEKVENVDETKAPTSTMDSPTGDSGLNSDTVEESTRLLDSPTDDEDKSMDV